MKGPVPPVTFTDALPLVPLLQVTLLPTEAVMAGPPALETAAVEVPVQPFASVTMTVYEPAASPEAVAALPPDGVHEYV